MTTLFEEWIGERSPVFLGTNHLSPPLPFSNWYRFKEAFSPEIVKQALDQHPTKVRYCVDPFSGSGTTALTCQFLGIESKSYEVNPFLSDLGLAKVESYNVDSLEEYKKIFGKYLLEASPYLGDYNDYWLPPTFVEPGHNGRWLFSKEVATAIFQIRFAISRLDEPHIRRLFRVVLGGCLIPNSNVVINGKGRRYRPNWRNRKITGLQLYENFYSNLERSFLDISSYSAKSITESKIVNDDIRREGIEFPRFDVAVFSPPYPNSFDYTDVYNVELWVLGYLKNREDNRRLRKNTLTSHIQISKDFREFSNPPESFSITMDKLNQARQKLWDQRIISMINTYFVEMEDLLARLHLAKRDRGRVWIVVGNSQYAGVEIETGNILSDISERMGYSIVKREMSRQMRNSPQQGGASRLCESILVLE